VPVIDPARVAAALLPRYTVGDRLGSGAFGLVLAGHDTELDRPVAVKILPAGTTGDRFQTEARIVTRLDHPHIARAYDYIQADDFTFLIMELLGGGTLARRRLPAVAACAVGIAMADALTHAQAHGVLHRDIKPDNILFSAEGQPKLTDFGLGRIATEPTLTDGPLVGSPRYLAPEIISGEPASPRADLYALGVVLYELLAGHPMFAPGLSPAEILRHQLQVTPPVPDGVPGPVAAVLMAMVAKDPALRPANARVLVRALTDATATAYGDDWADRSGLVLRLRQGPGAEDPGDEGPVTHPSAPPPDASPSPIVVGYPPSHGGQNGPAAGDTPSDGLDLPTEHLPQPEPSGSPQGPAERRPPSRRRRRLVILAAGVGAAAVALTVTGLVVELGGTTASRLSVSGSPSATVAAGTVSLSLGQIGGLAAGPGGSVYLAGTGDSVIARLAPNGQETVVAGTGSPGFGFVGDGGPATDAVLARPSNVGVDGKGNLYIVDAGNKRIRRVDPGGRITTVAGGGTVQVSSLTGQGAPATSVQFSALGGQFAVDTNGDVYAASGSRVYEVDRAGTLRAIAMIGATSPTLPELTTGPLGALAVHDGRLYGSDLGDNEVRMLTPDGAVSTVAGTGTRGDTGDGGPAVDAPLDLADPSNSVSGYQPGIAVDTAGDLFITELSDNRIRRVDRSGTITAAAGTGIAGDTLTATPAVSARLNQPSLIAAAPDGGYFIGCFSHLYRVDRDGVLHVLPTG
jgi:serine/threonine protein kinase